jgi:cell division protein FtsQ
MIRDYARRRIVNERVVAWPARPRGPSRLGRAIRRGLRWAVLLAVLGGGGYLAWRGYHQLLDSSYFEIAEIVVEGNLQVSGEEVTASLDLGPRASLLAADLAELTRRVLRNPWIRDVAIRRQLPLSLVVRVVEREPAGILIGQRAVLVSTDEVVLAVLPEGGLPDLPVLRLARPAPLAPGESVAALGFGAGLALWRQLRQTSLLPGEPPQEIGLLSDGGFAVRMRPGLPVIKVRREGLEGQMDRLRRALSMAGASVEAVEYADLRFGETVVLKTATGGR